MSRLDSFFYVISEILAEAIIKLLLMLRSIVDFLLGLTEQGLVILLRVVRSKQRPKVIREWEIYRDSKRFLFKLVKMPEESGVRFLFLDPDGIVIGEGSTPYEAIGSAYAWWVLQSTADFPFPTEALNVFAEET